MLRKLRRFFKKHIRALKNKNVTDDFQKDLHNQERPILQPVRPIVEDLQSVIINSKKSAYELTARHTFDADSIIPLYLSDDVVAEMDASGKYVLFSKDRHQRIKVRFPIRYTQNVFVSLAVRLHEDTTYEIVMLHHNKRMETFPPLDVYIAMEKNINSVWCHQENYNYRVLSGKVPGYTFITISNSGYYEFVE